jgi:hypothetical protein
MKFVYKIGNKDYGRIEPRTYITYKFDRMSLNEYKGKHTWPQPDTLPSVALSTKQRKSLFAALNICDNQKGRSESHWNWTQKVMYSAVRSAQPHLTGRRHRYEPRSLCTPWSCTLHSKAIPLQPLTGPECSSRLRLPDFMTIGTWRW